MAAFKQEPPSIKMEQMDLDTNPNIHIKSEPSIKPEALSDDEYEDAGDLDLSQGKRGVWLVKIPRFIMEKWDKIDDEEEITLGHIWVKSDASGGQRLKCILNGEAKCNEGLPLDYDMNVTNMSVNNTFVFSEKDLPGFKEGARKGPGGEAAAGAGPTGPAKSASSLHLGPGSSSGYAINKNSNSRKVHRHRQPFVRRAIPKHTALVGTVKHEASFLPVHTKAYTQLMSERTSSVLKPKQKIKFIDRVINPNLQAPGTVGAAGASGSTFADFIKHDKGIKKPTDGKTTRMPRNELVDALFRCFQQYTAWSIKGLREHLAQPESYLKEILTEIAILHRSGKFAQKYTLKPEYTQQAGDAAGGAGGDMRGAGAAGDAEGGGGGGTVAPEVIDIDDEEEEDDVEMEDVL